MKKILLLLSAAGLIAATAYAQTQKTNRTKTRTHDRTEVTKDAPPSDQDKNNPDMLQKSQAERDRLRDSVSKARQR